MRYAELVNFYDKIEATSSRISMTYHLVDLFKKTPENIIDKVVYLTEGKLYPNFVGIELGMAEKMALRALSMATGMSIDKVENEYKKRGDIGIISENLLKTRSQTTLFKRDLDVESLYEDLDKIAKTSGSGSADAKIRILSGLLTDASPREAKYIMRIVTGKMRLGIADMTIIDALSQAFLGGKKDDVERAYNVTSDLGEIAKTLRMAGLGEVGSGIGIIEKIKGYHPESGKPIRMMLAQRLESAKDIIEKMGKCVSEYKYDGERVQIHKNGDNVTLYSRNLENITSQYPDIVRSAVTNIKVNTAIVEGECVAVNPDTGDMLPFQQLMRRRRKHDINEHIEKFPTNVYLFDALLIDGDDIMNVPLSTRRHILKNSIVENNGFKMSHALVSDNIKNIEAFFESAIQNGCEGLVMKGISTTYQAGARGWSWIKLKRSYQSKMVDPIDVVIVGAFIGKGRRSGSYGALLVAVYDQERDTFPTISKLGTGFTDEELSKLPEMLASYKLEKRHPRVESGFDADIWFEPKIVMETIGDELTLSPNHPCGYNRIREDAGIAMRFPRFTHNWRYDKSPEDATSVSEIIDMYNRQLKKISQY